MRTSYPLSLIIPASQDTRIARCLGSIPETLEVIVVLNNEPSDEVRAIVSSDSRCGCVTLPGKTGLSAVFNAGIAAATQPAVAFIDTDCLAPDGWIPRVCGALEQFEVVKTRVDFEWSSYSSRLVAKTRWLHHHVFRDGRILFSPGLAFRTSILTKIGGYAFDPSLPWGSDGELSRRILSTSISVAYLEACLRHDSESLLHDLLVAYRIGTGERIYDQYRGVRAADALRRDLTTFLFDKRGRFRVAVRNAGLLVATYFLLWKLVNRLGYYLGRRQNNVPSTL